MRFKNSAKDLAQKVNASPNSTQAYSLRLHIQSTLPLNSSGNFFIFVCIESAWESIFCFQNISEDSLNPWGLSGARKDGFKITLCMPNFAGCFVYSFCTA